MHIHTYVDVESYLCHDMCIYVYVCVYMTVFVCIHMDIEKHLTLTFGLAHITPRSRVSRCPSSEPLGAPAVPGRLPAAARRPEAEAQSLGAWGWTIHICICMYMCIYKHTHTHTYIYVYMHIVYIYIYYIHKIFKYIYI